LVQADIGVMLALMASRNIGIGHKLVLDGKVTP